MFSGLRNFGGTGDGGRPSGGNGDGARPLAVTQPRDGDDDDNNWELVPPEGTAQRGRGGGRWEGGDGIGTDGGGYEGGGRDDRDGGDVNTMGDTVASGSGGSGGRGGAASVVSVHTGGSQGGGGDKPGVGLAAVLQRIGDEGRTVPTVMAELKWQREVNGETARTDAFREKTLSLLEFKLAARHGA